MPTILVLVVDSLASAGAILGTEASAAANSSLTLVAILHLSSELRRERWFSVYPEHHEVKTILVGLSNGRITGPSSRSASQP